MMSSAKDLSKAINHASANLTLPLPEDLVEVINAYLEKHTDPDESASQRLQDELLNIYQSSIPEHPSRLAPFIFILRTLKPVIRGGGRLLLWWDKLSLPIINYLAVEKGLAVEARDTLLEILVYDEDEPPPQLEESKVTSAAVAETLLATWLSKTKLASEEFDDHARFVESQIQIMLISFGKRRPKDFLTTINKFFVKKDSRILVLSLLCEFIRHQPPHLHQLLQTPLFDNLLKCLQIDTSTRAISLAMTALIMFLPHIPKSASAHLPALFNIYSRMLFWDRERRAAEPRAPDSDDEKSETTPQSPETDTWVKLPYLLESEDESVPELLHYFTFLYGLYPINFMSYIRKPQRYLRHANFPGADDLDIEPTEIRERSDPFRRVHLLHPNFFHLTIESELTDNNRWMKSEAADVVAECMALYVPGEDEGHATRSRVPGKKVEANADIPEQPLLDDAATPFQSRHNSWRDTRSTAVASPEGCRTSGLHRKLSQASQSMPSIADSPSVRASDRLDSPTLPAQMLPSPSHHQLSDMLNATHSTRGSLYQALTNDSVASLALSNTNQEPSHVDTYLSSLNRDTAPRSPSLRPTTTDPSLKIAYLHREIQLLHNDLNFERYLKQQHLSHIGQLRRKQIREARVEAETQNLINSNRGLKSKLEEAKRTILQMKKETEKSKTHSRKWESDLSAKLRVLREEQKKWNLEREDLKRDLQEAGQNVERLKQLVITSESQELSSRQKFMSVEGNLEELERLRTEVESLTVKLRTYEAEEIEALNAFENEEAACNRVKLLEMELEARDRELAAAKHAFENEISTVRNGRLNGSPKKDQRFTQDMVDSALSASRHRIVEIQKAHNHLLKRYTALENAYLDLKEHLEENEKGDEALLSGYRSASPSPTSTHSNVMYRRRAHANSDPDIYQPGPSGVFPVRPARLDTTSHKSSTPSSPVHSHSQTQHFHPPQPFSPTAGPASSKGSTEEPHGKQKILPQSEVRVYGRGKSTYLSGRVPFHRTTAAEIYGGVQNIGKKEKDKEKEKEKEGKEKKSIGIRGIRGFV